MIPRSRLDALTDGVYAFAMTLLVIDLRLPESLRPTGTESFLHALSDLWPQFLVYVISFWVLGLHWLGQLQLRGGPETVSHGYGMWVLMRLFFVTCVPFSTMLVGRYDEFAPAVWVYAANMIFGAVVALRLLRLDARDGVVDEDHGAAQVAMIAAGVLSVAISLHSTRYAMAAYALTAVPAIWARRAAKKS